MPIQNQERRTTLNQNQQMDIDDDDTGLDSIESLVLFDRSRSIKAPDPERFHLHLEAGQRFFWKCKFA